ncbi:hypothetical protein KIL84_013565 [Mauremys mutica]|uniref:Uncharacterized protein n=1 Tax=Mauremys mutica TaxID=74926 RepID=A0A9D4AUG5_9SAUR|nr:hypothetical protein KIL84_013565 [Mauremys mutica]
MSMCVCLSLFPHTQPTDITSPLHHLPTGAGSGNLFSAQQHYATDKFRTGSEEELCIQLKLQGMKHWIKRLTFFVSEWYKKLHTCILLAHTYQLRDYPGTFKV